MASFLGFIAVRGINSAIYCKILDQTGFVANIAKTTTPLFKSALAFGAMHGALHYSTHRLKKKAQQDWIRVDSPFQQVAEGGEILFLLATRYLVADVCGKFFGFKITRRYIHLLNGVELLSLASNDHPFFVGMLEVVHAVATQIFSDSLFIASPTFGHTFYFGCIEVVVLAKGLNIALGVHQKLKKYSGIKDLRILFISKLVLGLLPLAPRWVLAKACMGWFGLKISKQYLIATTIPMFAGVFLIAIISHIQKDFFDFDITTLDRLVDSSTVSGIREKWNQIKSAYRIGDAELLSEAFSRLFILEQRNLIGLLMPYRYKITSNWLSGTPKEEIALKILECLVEDRIDVTPNASWDLGFNIIDAMNVMNVDVDERRTLPDLQLKEGAEFITQVVLKDASKEKIELFKDIQGNSLQFTITRTVAEYIMGEKKDADPPLFFLKKTREAITTLRKEISANEEPYKKVLECLVADVKLDSQEFFGFRASLNPEEQAALKKLEEIAFLEMSSEFATRCYYFAT